MQPTCNVCALLLGAERDLTILATLLRATAPEVDVHVRFPELRVVVSFILVRTNRRAVDEPTRSTGTSTAVIPKKQVPPAPASERVVGVVDGAHETARGTAIEGVRQSTRNRVASKLHKEATGCWNVDRGCPEEASVTPIKILLGLGTTDGTRRAAVDVVILSGQGGGRSTERGSN